MLLGTELYDAFINEDDFNKGIRPKMNRKGGKGKGNRGGKGS